MAIRADGKVEHVVFSKRSCRSLTIAQSRRMLGNSLPLRHTKLAIESLVSHDPPHILERWYTDDDRWSICFAGSTIMHVHSIPTNSAAPFPLLWPVHGLRKKAQRLAVRLVRFLTFCADAYSARVQYEDLAKAIEGKPVD